MDDLVRLPTNLTFISDVIYCKFLVFSSVKSASDTKVHKKCPIFSLYFSANIFKSLTKPAHHVILRRSKLFYGSQNALFFVDCGFCVRYCICLVLGLDLKPLHIFHDVLLITRDLVAHKIQWKTIKTRLESRTRHKIPNKNTK